MITICQLAAVLIVINSGACPKGAKPLGTYDLNNLGELYLARIICGNECVDKRQTGHNQGARR